MLYLRYIHFFYLLYVLLSFLCMSVYCLVLEIILNKIEARFTSYYCDLIYPVGPYQTNDITNVTQSDHSAHPVLDIFSLLLFSAILHMHYNDVIGSHKVTSLV